MNIIFAELGSERHRAMIEAISNGAAPADVAERFRFTKETVQRIARQNKKLMPVELTLTDGQTTLPVATVMTTKGFVHACKTAIRTYSGMFSRLELPSWRLVSQCEAIKLSELRDE